MSLILLPVVILTLVFCGLLFVAATVGSVLFVAGPPGSGVSRVGRSLAIVCGSTLGVLLCVGTLVSFGVGHSRVVIHHQAGQQQPARQTANEGPLEILEAEAAEADHPVTANVDHGLVRLADENSASPPVEREAPSNGHDDRTTASAARPDWTLVSETKHGDVRQVVLSSKQYSTIEEARGEVAAAAKQLLLQDFESIYHTSADPLRELPMERLKAMAVRNEFIETVDRDFGSFFAPMHRVWWQVELSPVVRTNLHPVWKTALQKTRTIAVGASLTTITLVLAGWSLLTRRRVGVMRSSS